VRSLVRTDPEHARRLALTLRACAFRCELAGVRWPSELLRQAAEEIWPDGRDVDREILDAMQPSHGWNER
jgi:hypothetical protein